MKVFFVNLDWLDGNYDRKELPTKQSQSGFSYSKENAGSYVHECFNFKNVDGRYYAYVPRVESLKIENLGAKPSDEFVSGVFVVFISKERNKQRKVVGYYENATVYRYIQKGPNKIGNTNIGYLVSAKKAVVFDKDDRPVAENISSHTGSKGLFGQSPVWYPNLEDDNIKNIVGRILYDISPKSLIADYGNLEEYNNKLDEDTLASYEDDAQKRAERLKNAPKYPEEKQMVTKQYLRNPDVKAEVLHRANGVCEKCHRKAPFITKSTGKPYLEVHHVVPLSQGGEDTVENAIAVCPNCHKELHFG